MEVKVLRKMGYENTFIYILQFGYEFQYLFPWQGEIYQQHREAKPQWWRRLLHRTGLVDKYSKDQMEQLEGVFINAAMDSINLLLEKDTKNKRIRAENLAKGSAKQKECTWQTRTDEDGKQFYYCVKHDVVVPFIEGEAPKHAKSK